MAKHEGFINTKKAFKNFMLQNEFYAKILCSKMKDLDVTGISFHVDLSQKLKCNSCHHCNC